jgi:hypothetical protein
MCQSNSSFSCGFEVRDVQSITTSLRVVLSTSIAGLVHSVPHRFYPTSTDLLLYSDRHVLLVYRIDSTR